MEKAHDSVNRDELWHEVVIYNQVIKLNGNENMMLCLSCVVVEKELKK